MTNLNLSYLSKSKSFYVFYLCKLTKTWRKGKTPPKALKLYSFLGENKLCVYTTFDTYLSKRESLDTHESRVLVSFVKPHKAVTSSTVSRRLKEGLLVARIDTRMFKSHSFVRSLCL